MKLGLIQMNMTSDLKANIAKARFRVFEAAKQGAQIVCLSELFSSLYFCQTKDPKFFEWAEAIPGPLTNTLGEWARELKIVLVGSVFEKSSEGRYFNTAVVLGAGGQLLGQYRKTHIPNDTANYVETYYFSPGDQGYPVFQTSSAKIGTLVCWDQWYPEPPRQLAAQGAQIIFYPTAIGYTTSPSNPQSQKEREAWITIQRAHAIANNVFVVAVNRVGKEGNIDFWGSSFVAGPLGEILAQAPQHEEKILVVDCNLSEIEKIRKDWPFLVCRVNKITPK